MGNKEESIMDKDFTNFDFSKKAISHRISIMDSVRAYQGRINSFESLEMRRKKMNSKLNKKCQK